ncbi:MAG: phenylalanine--tRNA ligase subunit beta [Actinobacteria bacterium]|nr:phenylalanine--tRNA ligase subunit beta [Actinomycetota bacterium]
MRITMSWLRELVDLPSSATAHDVAASLIGRGFEVEGIESFGGDLTGPIVVGRVEQIEELTEFKKPIRFCQVDVGPSHGGRRGIVCGARNFTADDLVVVALPGAVLPGGFAISARETYGHVSDGMICSERELGLSQEHSGIMVLDDQAEVGTDALSLLGLGDTILDISVNPDRGYAMSMRGLAREVAGAYNLEFRDPVDLLTDLPQPVAGSVPVGATVSTPACALFVLRTICDLDPQAQTPRWMRNRLVACGVRPVSLVVDVTNYVMLETGQPLHAFDASRITGDIDVRLASAGERLELIDHTVKALDPADIVIADQAGVLSLAGIMGGSGSEISPESTAVVIEAAHFDAAVIAQSCRRHRVSTDASRRFERGVDSRLAPFAAHRAAQLLVDLAGGRNHGLVATETEREAPDINVTASYISSRIGIEVEADDAADILRSLGCDVGVCERDLRVSPPSWRPDLRAACDVSEEIARVTGYDVIPSILPRPAQIGGLTAAQSVRRLRDGALVARGWTQVALSPFMAATALESFQCEPGDPRLAAVPLLNPLSEEEPVLRTTLLPALAAAIARNRSRGMDAVALFESSVVHIDVPRTPCPTLPRGSRPSEAQLQQALACIPREISATAGIAVGAWSRQSWVSAAQTWQWWHAVAAAQAVAAVYATSVVTRKASAAGWHPGRCAELVVDNGGEECVVGWAGELHPRVIAAWGLPDRAVAFEVRTSELAEIYSRTARTQLGAALPTAGVLKEDLALVVPAAVAAADVAAAVAEGCGPLLESIELFDDYRGAGIDPGMKSIAFALRFRHPERSLRDDEVAQLRESGIARAASAFGAALRGRA